MKKTHLWEIMVLLILLLVLAACGGTAEQPANTAVPTNTTIPSTVAPTASTTAATNTAVPDTPQPAPTEDTAIPATATTEVMNTPAEETAVNTKLNLNTASGDDYLNTIPDFSNRMVREFLEYRPYISIQQFRREIGKYVSDEQVATYEQYVYVPIDIDEADAATLQQIPGVDETLATTLINGRPYNSNDTFLAKLGELAPGIDLTMAASYLTAK